MENFKTLYNKIIFEDLNKLPTPDTILPENLCNPNNCYKWVKGQANVYGCKITEENVETVKKFLKVREKANLIPQIGRYVVYNPNIPEKGGQIWMNKLSGYTEATKENSKFDSLTLAKKINEGEDEENNEVLNFTEYVFLPKTKDEEMVEGEDWWYGFQIPKTEDFKIADGCGNNGADGSTAYKTDWLPIVNGKFDWARSRESMKQSNFVCVEKGSVKLSDECQKNWDEKDGIKE